MSSRYRQIVVKVGTNVLTNDKGLLEERVMASLVAQIVALKSTGVQVVLVTSGAMAAGRAVTTLKRKLSNVAERQILAAVGQVQLMHRYSTLFAKEKCGCAQVLATKEDFRDRQHYLNMRSCLTSLLSQDIVPIVNENDVVSVSELMFTDNDELAGLIASMVGADALILLTSVDGIQKKETGEVLRTVSQESDWKEHLRAEMSSFGRGGMQTKCRIAQKLAALGIVTHIARGTTPEILKKILKGDTIGTMFPAKKRSASSMKRWVAEGAQEKGTVTVNERAKDALRGTEKAVSLLPIGVIKIEGEFAKGDLIRIRDEKGHDIGFGLAHYASSTAKEAMGKKGQKPLVHYDYLYLAS